jgi:hypothetical protein
MLERDGVAVTVDADAKGSGVDTASSPTTTEQVIKTRKTTGLMSTSDRRRLLPHPKIVGVDNQEAGIGGIPSQDVGSARVSAPHHCHRRPTLSEGF